LAGKKERKFFHFKNAMKQCVFKVLQSGIANKRIDPRSALSLWIDGLEELEKNNDMLCRDLGLYRGDEKNRILAEAVGLLLTGEIVSRETFDEFNMLIGFANFTSANSSG